LVDKTANADGRVETGLSEISKEDPSFDVEDFVKGAKAAFGMIVKAYAAGDTAVLEPLLSPKLFADFKSGIAAREAQRHKVEVIIHRITAARITEAHLGGAMAYITIDYDVEETTVTRDEGGNVVEGDPDRIFSMNDIWTFTRDTRSRDPNWILIETRAP
jgi:predicted lipid-binding transport protein (Tim44 family)